MFRTFSPLFNNRFQDIRKLIFQKGCKHPFFGLFQIAHYTLVHVKGVDEVANIGLLRLPGTLYKVFDIFR